MLSGRIASGWQKDGGDRSKLVPKRLNTGFMILKEFRAAASRVGGKGITPCQGWESNKKKQGQRSAFIFGKMDHSRTRG